MKRKGQGKDTKNKRLGKKRRTESETTPASQKRICRGPCGQEKGLDQFKTDSRSKDGKQRLCKDCNNKRRMGHMATERGFIQKLVADMVKSDKKIRSRVEECISDQAFDTMDFGPFQALVLAQQKACAICALPNSFKPNSHFRASPDRLDNDLTHCAGNVRVVCAEFNGPLSWSTEELDDFIRLATHPTDSELLAQIWASAASLTKRKSPQKSIVRFDEETKHHLYKCHGPCGQFKQKNEMHKKTQCKKCNNRRHKSSVRSIVKRLVASSKSHAKKINATMRDPKLHLTCIISEEFVLELLKRQHGRCAYSNVPFMFECLLKPGQHMNALREMSVERINPMLGYTPDNVCLICRGFQSQDNSRRAKYSNGGSGGWSKAKWEYMVYWRAENKAGATMPSMTFEEFKHRNDPAKDSSIHLEIVNNASSLEKL